MYWICFNQDRQRFELLAEGLPTFNTRCVVEVQDEDIAKALVVAFNGSMALAEAGNNANLHQRRIP